MKRPMPPSTKAMICPVRFGGVAKPTVLSAEPLATIAWTQSVEA